MAMYVTNNTAAMNTSRWLGINTSNMESSLAKLSSGYKINTAADDPAGLVISEKLRAQLDGLSQAVSNNQEASNVIGIAEGALSEMNDILKKMEELALHAANSGITSSDQVVADQAEMDSAVQTIDRIANTTKYSDTYLLNGTQQIGYSVNTVVDSTEDAQLLDAVATKIYQVSSLETKINISYTGENSGGTAITTSSAQKAVLEASSATAGADMDGTSLTADLAMTITGSLGSKAYSFGDGQSLGSVAATINEDASSTGVAAQLIFDSAVTGVAESGSFSAGTTSHTTATITAYELDKDFKQDTSYNVTGATLGSGAVVVGGNTDADGNVYVKFTGTGANATYEIYKDKEMTTLVGAGILGEESTVANNSGLTLTLTTDIAQTASDVAIINVGSSTEVSTVGTSGLTSGTVEAGTTGTGGAEAASVLTGIRLGENTDADGKIYMKTVVDGGDVTVNLYNDSAMEDTNLVATGTIAAADVTDAAVNGIEVYAVTSNGGNTTTGLYGTINMSLDSAGSTAAFVDTGINATYTSEIVADDLGVRLSSTSYGDEAEVSVKMTQGAIFTDNNDKLVDSSNAATDMGQDGKVTVNGQKYDVGADMTITIANTELNADLVMDDGKLGATTIAVQGYTDGALASKVGAIADTTNHSTQTIQNTSETVQDLTGGMQIQTGEGTNTYESTVISVQSMTASDLGRTAFTDDFDGDGIKEEKTLTLTDLQSGGYADLSTDTDKALTIIKQAIDDVSMARARLGAVQSNMLETNINSLNVAIENITSTESAIRDTDMSTESTEYTKNQILVQAATSMLAQANTLPQQALSLLQG